jgi:hypothetical protein
MTISHVVPIRNFDLIFEEQNHNKHDFEKSKFSKFSIFFSEISMRRKRVSSLPKRKKMTISHVDRIRIFNFIFEE